MKIKELEMKLMESSAKEPDYADMANKTKQNLIMLLKYNKVPADALSNDKVIARHLTKQFNKFYKLNDHEMQFYIIKAIPLVKS